MKSINPPIGPEAAARVRDPKPRPRVCPNCGTKVYLVKNSEIYGREYGCWPYAYLCETRCSYVGLHPGTEIPLGTMANAETREARKDAKRHFEPLWRGRRAIFRKRKDAYAWLAGRLGVDVRECHFGWFDKDQADRAREICRARLMGRRS